MKQTTTDTLGQIRADSEFCSEHLHNTLAESKACKRAVTDSRTVAGEFRVNETFNKGDVLEIKAHHSDKGKGLSYPDMTVLALESGTIGGWDVYDGQLENWTQVSFYGFSVI